MKTRTDGNKCRDRPAIFIVGMNGSGTTILGNALGRHPNIYTVPGETRVIPYFLATEDRYGSLHDDTEFLRLWEKLRHDSAFTMWNGDQPIPLPRNPLAMDRSTASVVDNIFSWFAHRAGKTRWCERSPTNVRHIGMLANGFNNSKFIHILRDGRDAAASFHRRFGVPPRITIENWKRTVEQARSDALVLEGHRYLEVRYEALTQSTEATMRKLCDFVEEPFHIDTLTPPTPRNAGVSGVGLKQNSQKWRSYFSPRQVQRLESQAGSMLSDLGYTVSNRTGDSSLSAPVRVILESMNFVSRSYRISRDILGEESKSRAMSRIYGHWQKARRRSTVDRWPRAKAK